MIGDGCVEEDTDGVLVTGGSGREIDVVAPTSGDTPLVGEAKFRQEPVGYDGLGQLEDEAPLVDWQPDSGGDPAYEYCLFSRSGFESSVEEAASDRDDLRSFTVEDVVDLITGRGLSVNVTDRQPVVPYNDRMRDPVAITVW